MIGQNHLATTASQRICLVHAAEMIFMELKIPQ
jgi:hypothetical protein